MDFYGLSPPADRMGTTLRRSRPSINSVSRHCGLYLALVTRAIVNSRDAALVAGSMVQDFLDHMRRNSKVGHACGDLLVGFDLLQDCRLRAALRDLLHVGLINEPLRSSGDIQKPLDGFAGVPGGGQRVDRTRGTGPQDNPFSRSTSIGRAFERGKQGRNISFCQIEGRFSVVSE